MPDTSEDRSKEPITWDEEKRKATEGKPPTAKYGSASESIRQTIPAARICAMFCGGKKCKYEDVTNWKEEEMEIKGLYSNWITPNIVAIARPNTPNIVKYDIIQQFKDQGISSIINLQEPGEHCTCGPGLEPGGFSYNQQDFMDNDIFFYNFGWQDYGVGSLTNILDMVKVMQFALSEGKVAIHCHAGLGRTGVLIACYLVFANRMDPGDVVHYIRSKRPPSVQTRSQILCIQEFAKYLQPLRVVFSLPDADSYDFTLSQYLIRQKHMLHGYEARRLKLIPKIVYECCERLLMLSGHGHSHRHRNSVADVLKTAPSALNNRTPRLGASQSDHDDPDGKINSLKSKSVSLESFTALGIVKTGYSKSAVSLVRSGSSLTNNSDYSDSDSIQSYTATPVGSDMDLTNCRRTNGVSSDIALAPSASREDTVAHFMAITEYDEETKKAIEDLKHGLNEDNSTWREITKLKDPKILAGLMWSWLDHLKEPVLSAQDLPHMLEYTGDPMAGLELLNKGAKHTVEFLFKTIARLHPLSDDAERNIVQRVLSTLTHQNMVVEMDKFTTEEKFLIKRTSNPAGVMRNSVANRMMFFFMHLIHLLQRAHSAEKMALQQQDKNTMYNVRNTHSLTDTTQKKASNRLTSSQYNHGRRKSLEAEDAVSYKKQQGSESLQIRKSLKGMKRNIKLEEEAEESETESEEELVVSSRAGGIPKTSLRNSTPTSKR